MKFAALAAAAAATLLAPPAPTQPAAETAPGFEFNLPDSLSESPGLAEQLRYKRQSALYEYERNRREFAAEAHPEQAAHLANLQYAADWSLAGATGELVSLSASIYTYLGGAHGNTTFDSVLWDVADERALDFTELFADRYGAMAEIDRRFCDALAALQVERTGESHLDSDRGCPVLHQQTLVPAGAPGEPMTTIQVLVPPYVAGPYVAGTFEVEVPVTEALIALLRPEYASSFTVQQ